MCTYMDIIWSVFVCVRFRVCLSVSVFISVEAILPAIPLRTAMAQIAMVAPSVETMSQRLPYLRIEETKE